MLYVEHKEVIWQSIRMLYDEHKEVIWQSAGGYVKQIEKPGVGGPLLGPAKKY